MGFWDALKSVGQAFVDTNYGLAMAQRYGPQWRQILEEQQRRQAQQRAQEQFNQQRRPLLLEMDNLRLKNAQLAYQGRTTDIAAARAFQGAREQMGPPTEAEAARGPTDVWIDSHMGRGGATRTGDINASDLPIVRMKAQKRFADFDKEQTARIRGEAIEQRAEAGAARAEESHRWAREKHRAWRRKQQELSEAPVDEKTKVDSAYQLLEISDDELDDIEQAIPKGATRNIAADFAEAGAEGVTPEEVAGYTANLGTARTTGRQMVSQALVQRLEKVRPEAFKAVMQFMQDPSNVPNRVGWGPPGTMPLSQADFNALAALVLLHDERELAPEEWDPIARAAARFLSAVRSNPMGR